MGVRAGCPHSLLRIRLECLAAAAHIAGMTIVLGITGSIAAYKAADLASQLVKQGHEVHAVLTRAGAEFITPLTLQTLTRQAVLVAPGDEKASWKPGHIELADRADLLVVAPATANVLGNFANGLAPDPLASIYLAMPRRTPVLLAPAMNGKMWLHPATQRNVARLVADGCSFVGPAEGDLACGYEGVGRLAPVAEILARIAEILEDARQQDPRLEDARPKTR